MASFSVCAPDVTALTLAPSSFMRNTLGLWRSTSTAPMKISQEGGVGLRILPGPPELQDQRHQGLGDETPAEQAEEAPVVRAGPISVELRLLGFLLLRCHDRSPCRVRHPRLQVRDGSDASN